MAVQCANSAGQLINTSTNIAVPIVMPFILATTANYYTYDVWINANWGTSTAPRGRHSFCGIYGPAARTAGLAATYYSNKTLTEPANTYKVDPIPNMNTASGSGPAGTTIPNDVFSTRWQGYFNPPSTGTYYFQTSSDDGCRVTINGTMVINNWVDQSTTTTTGTAIALTAGTEVSVLVEYYNQGGPGVFTLSYAIGSATGTFTAVTASQFNTSAPLTNATTALQIGTSTGAGEISCWTYGGNTLVTTATNFNPAANNTWVNVTYVFNGSQHLLYVNGALAATATTDQQPGSLKYITINGYYGGGAAETDNHYVDSVSLYNRALSADEILSLNTAAGNRHADNYGLIADYEFDEGVEGTNVATSLDLTGSGATLLMTGTGTAPKYSYSNSIADANTRPVLLT